ncbi:MAG: ABC transporter ATP-binding protein [Phycisphaerales bacterium]|nr:MAG: ABC transporter ATP-binding protein [Phycisphaerales bacterium]
MRPATLQAKDIEKYFFIERPLHKQFLSPFARGRRIHALNRVSFTLESGKILGVVGPNGAGKTTLLRILAHLLEPDGGEVTLCGRKMTGRSHYLRKQVGYVSSDDRSFFWRLTGRQNLEFFSRLYGVPRSRAGRGISDFLEMFGLEKKANELFRDYSTGTRKKFALIRALVHQPSVILLDEVTNSLDGPSTAYVKDMVREYVSGRADCSGVWSTHRLEEIYEICDKVVVIEEGNVKFFGPAEELKDSYDHRGGYLGKRDAGDGLKRPKNSVLADNA